MVSYRIVRGEDVTADELKEMVAAMRELGVSEANGIKLGPPILPPPKEETKAEWEARIAREQEREQKIMFAASGTRPRLKVIR